MFNAKGDLNRDRLCELSGNLLSCIKSESSMEQEVIDALRSLMEFLRDSHSNLLPSSDTLCDPCGAALCFVCGYIGVKSLPAKVGA